MELPAWVHVWVQAIATWLVHVGPELVMAGGALSALLALLHLSFWRLLDWREDLRTLTFVNRAMVQILNLSVALIFAIFAYLSLGHAPDLTASVLGSRVLALMASFWLLRAVLQAAFFRLRRRSSRALFAIFLLGTALFGAPAVVAIWPGLAST